MGDHQIISTPDMWPEALAHLRAKHRAGGHVNYIGGPADSITDGYGASSRENGWWSRFARTMARALHQPSRAIGSAEIALDSSWPVWTMRGTPAQSSGRSLGRHGVVLLRGTIASTVQPCDRVRILLDETTRAFEMEGGTLEIRIDGDVVATLECHHDDVVGRAWDSGPLGEFAPRHVELRCVAGDFVSVGHSYFHDGVDGDRGALFWRNAHARYAVDGGSSGSPRRHRPGPGRSPTEPSAGTRSATVRSGEATGSRPTASSAAPGPTTSATWRTTGARSRRPTCTSSTTSGSDAVRSRRSA